MVSTTHCYLKTVPLGQLLVQGRQLEGTFQMSKEPLIVWVQFMCQPAVMTFWWPPPTCHPKLQYIYFFRLQELWKWKVYLTYVFVVQYIYLHLYYNYIYIQLFTLYNYNYITIHLFITIHLYNLTTDLAFWTLLV